MNKLVKCLSTEGDIGIKLKKKHVRSCTFFLIKEEIAAFLSNLSSIMRWQICISNREKKYEKLVKLIIILSMFDSFLLNNSGFSFVNEIFLPKVWIAY